MRICFHRWKYVYDFYLDTFLGEPIERTFIRFRICKKCEQVQEFCDDSQGGYWNTLGDDKANILKSKIIDKGENYEISEIEHEEAKERNRKYWGIFKKDENV